jgi:hypothetical protein
MADTFGLQFEAIRTKLKETNYSEVMLYSAEDALLYVDGNTSEKAGIPCPENGQVTIFLVFSTDDTGAGGTDTITARRVGSGNIALVAGGSSVVITDTVNTTNQSVELTSAAGFAVARAIVVYSEIDRAAAPYTS